MDVVAPRNSSRTPKLRLHKATGQGYVELNRKRIYLGRFDAPTTREKYHRMIAEWEAAGRQMLVAPGEITVVEIVQRFWLHAKTHYRKPDGSPTSELENFRQALRPLLNRFGNESKLTIILFTLDEATYSRELAPLAGHYPCLRLGPPWWFNDSPEGMMRFRQQVTETAGFYNTVGFNDDTRAFLSIPARHDVARRIDCAFLARLVAEHRLDEDEAFEVAHELAYGLVKKAYKL